MKKVFKKNNGFTLVELLAVLGVIVVVGAVASAIILSSLRAASKANQLNIVRQNGNFAILQMTRTIQYAKSFVGVSTDNVNYVNDCSSQNSSTHYFSIKVVLFDESSVAFSCSPAGNPNTISSTINGQVSDIIDLNSVAVSDCFFTCSQSFRTDSPAIGINLTLTQASNTSFVEKSATVPFSTTITMRNPNK